MAETNSLIRQYTHMKPIRHTLISQFIRDNRGVAYIEFALALPFLLLLFAGALDVTRMVLLHQKIDRAAYTVGDLATQLKAETGVCNTVKNWETNVVQEIMKPFAFSADDYNFVMSAVLGAEPDWDKGEMHDLIEWRYGKGPSQIGAFSAPYQQEATLPPTISGLEGNERVIVTEMTYYFEPMLPIFSTVTEHNFTKVSYFRSRVSTGREGRGTGVLSGC